MTNFITIAPHYICNSRDEGDIFVFFGGGGGGIVMYINYPPPLKWEKSNLFAALFDSLSRDHTDSSEIW
jgi:hypothetical protein